MPLWTVVRQDYPSLPEPRIEETAARPACVRRRVLQEHADVEKDQSHRRLGAKRQKN